MYENQNFYVPMKPFIYILILDGGGQEEHFQEGGHGLYISKQSQGKALSTQNIMWPWKYDLPVAPATSCGTAEKTQG